jgi:hypothetical protein
MKIFILVVTVLLSSTAVEVNGQSSLFVTNNFRNFINYEVNAAVSAFSSQTVINNFICMYMCMKTPNCTLAVFKSSKLCSLYSSSAITLVIVTSTGSWLYQKQISGYLF